MVRNKLKAHQTNSVIKSTSRISVADLKKDNCFKLSLKHLDREQGQSHFDWEKNNMLASAFETLANYCSLPLKSQQNKKFTIYPKFPPKNKTEFTHPKHIPEDAEWARIHVNGKHCIIGHVCDEVFYVVFFDKDHKFWISELKHT